MTLIAVEDVARTHELKTWPDVFDAMLTRAKSFEIRKDDRGFSLGDMLVLREWDPAKDAYTGRRCRALVTYITPGGRFGVEAGYVCMGVRRLP